MTTLADAPGLRAGELPPGRLARARGTVAAYVALTKPRIIELLLVTTVPAMVLAAQGVPPLGLVLATLVGGSLAAGSANALNCWYDRDIDVVMKRTRRRPLAQHTVSPRGALVFGLVLGLVLATLVGGSLAAGSANALNCWYDRDIDVVMKRTRRRPLAQHTVSPRGALVFGLVLGVLSAVLLAVTTNPVAAGLAVAAIAFYVLVYTMVLKRRTSQNIVWGGAAGCMPVLIGWAAVTGSLAWAPVVLFAVIFLWTPPHYWPLAMRYRDDYAAAGVPMLPVVAASRVVAGRIVAYSWAMVAVSLLLVWPLGVSGALYGTVAVVAGAVFLREAHLLRARVRGGDDACAMRLFHWSITYLALLFLAVAVDQLV